MDHKLRFSVIRILIVTLMVIALFLMSTLLRNKAVQPVQAQQEVIDFEDMPEGTVYRVGRDFISGGLPFCVESYTNQRGVEIFDGFVRIDTYEKIEGNSQEVFMHNANVRLGFSGEIYRLKLDYAYKVGGINIEVNGDPLSAADPNEFIDQEIGGVSVSWEGVNDEVGNLTLEGVIGSFAIGGQYFFIDNIQLEGDFSPLILCDLSAAFRILLVTNENRVEEYNISIQPGHARGHPNQFNQWLVIVLDQDRQPLDVYGIWDPRLTLVHGLEDKHSTLEFDQDTAYLFDLVFPVAPGDSSELATEVLLYDQNLTLLADVVLIPAITDYYCSDEERRSPVCDTYESIKIDPALNLEGVNFTERPEAVTPEEFEFMADSELIANCLLSLAESTFSPEEKVDILDLVKSTCNNQRRN